MLSAIVIYHIKDFKVLNYFLIIYILKFILINLKLQVYFASILLKPFLWSTILVLQAALN